MSRRSQIHQLRSETLDKYIVLHVEVSPINPANLVLHMICDRTYTYKAELKQYMRATYRHPQFQGTNDELQDLLLRALLSNSSDQKDQKDVAMGVVSSHFPYPIELILLNQSTKAGIARLKFFQTNEVAPMLDWAVKAYRERDRCLEKLESSQKATVKAKVALKESEKTANELRTAVSNHVTERERDRKELETAKKEAIQAQTAAKELQTTAEDVQRKLDEQGRLIETMSGRLKNIKQLKLEEEQLLVLKAAMSSKELTIRSLREEIEKNGGGQEELAAESPLPTLLIQGGPGDSHIQPESTSEHHPSKKRKATNDSEAINAAHGLSIL